MTTIRFEIIKDIDLAEKYWKQFSPHESIYDEWEFRYLFYRYFQYELFFYLGLVNNIPIGLLPLVLNSQDNALEFIGGDYMEDNKIFIHPEYTSYIPDFYKNIQQPAALLDISGEDPFTKTFKFEDYTYYTDLKDLKNTDDFIERNFAGKSKKNLKYDLRKVTSNVIEIVRNDYDNLPLMFSQNINVFSEESWFKEPFMEKVFSSFQHLSFPVYFFTYLVNGIKEGTSLSLKYKDTYVLFNYSSDKEKIPNMGKYIILHTIQNAIDTNAHTFEAGVGDCNWKEHWNLQKKTQYEYYYLFP